MTSNKPVSETWNLALHARKLSREWFGDTEADASLAHMTLALCGEVGEVANVVKKIDRQSIKLDEASTQMTLAMELADVFIYFLNICAILRIDPAQIYFQKQATNQRRFVQEREQREREASSSQEQEIVDGIRVRRRAVS